MSRRYSPLQALYSADWLRDDDFVKPVANAAAPRPGRGAAKKTAYAEVSDDDDDFEP